MGLSSFQYKALTPEGLVIQNEWVGETALALEQELQDQHLKPLVIRHQWWKFPPRHLPLVDCQILCFHLGHLLQAGVPLLDALAELTPTPITRNLSALEKLAQESLCLVENGRTLSEALQHTRQIPEVITSLIHAGEQCGELAHMLLRLHTHLEWQLRQKATMRHALRYPLLVSAVLSCSMAFLMTFLLPQLRPFLLGLPPPLPVTTRALLWLNDFGLPLIAFGVTTLSSIVLGGAILIRYSPKARHQLAAWQLRVPIFGPLQLADERARLSSTLGLLYQAGIPVLEALALTRAVLHNVFLKHLLLEAETRLRQGLTLSQSLANPFLFSSLMRQMIRAGEKSGALDTALKEAAQFHQRQVQDMTKRLQSLLEPLLTLVLGGILGGVIHAVLMPLYGSFQRFG